MRKTIWFGLLMLGSVPLWCQVQPSATGGSLADTQMMTPPPVNGEGYASGPGDAEKSNFVTVGVVFTPAYDDNVLLNESTKQSDETYSITPSIQFERETARNTSRLAYNAGGFLYQHKSSLDALNQNLTAGFEHRFTRYASVQFRDRLQQNTNSFTNSNPFQPAQVTGGSNGGPQLLIAPYANQLTNTAEGALNYQFAKNAMVGGGGTYSTLRYSSLAQSTGLYNSDAGGVEAFYTRRVVPQLYLGAAYQFQNIQTHPIKTTAVTHAIVGFATYYVSRKVSLSMTFGPQHFDETAPLSPKVSGWSPALSAGLGWQARRANLAANFSRVVSGGNGLVGAYHASSVNGLAGWEFARRWNANFGASYIKIQNASALFQLSQVSGSTATGTVAVTHSIREFANIAFGYARFHENYEQVQSGTVFPDSNRVFASISYEFTRSIGR